MTPVNKVFVSFMLLIFLSAILPGISFSQQEKGTALREQIQDAQKLFERGKVDAAIYKLQQVHNKDQENVEVLFKLGEMAIAAKNWAYAINVLDKVSKLRAEDVEVRLVLMDIYRAYQMPIQEIMTGREILAIDPNSTVALQKLAFLYYGQDMPDEEEEIRRTLAKITPEDTDNLKKLAALQWKMEEVWEEALTHEKILKYNPDDVESLQRLARLYGEDGSNRDKLVATRKTLWHPKGRSFTVFKELGKSERKYKSQLFMSDFLKGDVLYEHSKGEEDKVEAYSGALGYYKVCLTHHSDFEASVKYKRTDYTPTAALTGGKKINSYSAKLIYDTRFREAKGFIKVQCGVDDIDVSGSVTALDPSESPTNYPWLENIKYGGTEFFGRAEVDRRIHKDYGINLHLERSLLKDLDAYVRLFTYNYGGIGLYYERPDRTRIEAIYDYGNITHASNRGVFKFRVLYPLYVSHSIYDYKGMRKKYMYYIPDQQLNLVNEFNHTKDQDISPYYESYIDSGEWRNFTTLSGRHRFYKSFFLDIDGTYGTGRYLDNYWGIQSGISYEDRHTNDKISLSYSYCTDELSEPKDGLNKTFSGESSSHAVTLSVLWHFGK